MVVMLIEYHPILARKGVSLFELHHSRQFRELPNKLFVLQLPHRLSRNNAQVNHSGILYNSDSTARMHIRDWAHSSVVTDWEGVGLAIWQIIQVNTMQMTELAKRLTFRITSIEHVQLNNKSALAVWIWIAACKRTRP